MLRIGRQTQSVKPLPSTNANVGGIQVRPLLGELPPLRLLTLLLFLRITLSGRMGR